MEKHRHFKVKGFLYFSVETEIHAVSKNMEKVDFHSTGKVWENTNISNSWAS